MPCMIRRDRMIGIDGPEITHWMCQVQMGVQ